MDEHIQETIQTLEFGSRCLSIENRPLVHKKRVDPKDTIIQELREELSKLRAKIEVMELYNNELQSLKSPLEDKNMSPIQCPRDVPSLTSSARSPTPEFVTETLSTDTSFEMPPVYMSHIQNKDNHTNPEDIHVDIERVSPSHESESHINITEKKSIQKKHIKKSKSVGCGCFGVYGRWQAQWMGVVVGGRILWGFDDLFDVSDGVSGFVACQATLGDDRPRSRQFDFRDRSLRSWPVASGQILGRLVDLPQRSLLLEEMNAKTKLRLTMVP